MDRDHRRRRAPRLTEVSQDTANVVELQCRELQKLRDRLAVRHRITSCLRCIARLFEVIALQVHLAQQCIRRWLADHDLERQLDPTRFPRVHRSTIVNAARVTALRPHLNGEYFLTLDSGDELKLSRTYRDRLSLSR